MKKLFLSTLAAILLTLPTLAQAGLLQKLSEEDLKQISLPGYDMQSDQAFKISTGPLAGKAIFFASYEPGNDKARGPQFVVTDKGKVIDSQTLPTLMEGWNIVQVESVSAMAGQGNSALRVLSILTMEPISNRPQDYWSQGFVFDISPDGKINVNSGLNEKISKAKPKIKTIEALKSFLNNPTK